MHYKLYVIYTTGPFFVKTFLKNDLSCNIVERKMIKAPEGNICTNHNRFPHIHFSSSHSFCPAVFAGVRVYVHVIQESCTVLRSWVRNAGRVHITLKPAWTERAQLRFTADLQWVITRLWTTLCFLGSCKWQKHVLRSLTLSLSFCLFFPQTGIRDFRKKLVSEYEYDFWHRLVENCQMPNEKDPLTQEVHHV